MNNYFKLQIKDYNNFDEIIEINNKINELKTVIYTNKNLIFEAHVNNTEIKAHVNFYLKINKKMYNNHNCTICYELLTFRNNKTLECNHDLCNDCYEKWNKICIDNSKITNCPLCRKIIT